MNDLVKSFDEKIQAAIAMAGHIAEVPIEISNLFAGGMYARVGDIPAGTLVISKVHKRQGFGILLKGEISVATVNGVERITAPRILVTEPGTQRAVYHHVDCTFAAVNNLDGVYDASTPLEEIEQYVVCDNQQEFEQFLTDEAKKMEALPCT